MWGMKSTPWVCLRMLLVALIGPELSVHVPDRVYGNDELFAFFAKVPPGNLDVHLM